MLASTIRVKWRIIFWNAVEEMAGDIWRVKWGIFRMWFRRARSWNAGLDMLAVRVKV
jgi:hypothetical protein